LINEAHEKFLAQQARAAKRRQQIRSASPAPPATFKAEHNKQKQTYSQDTLRRDEQRDTVNRNGVREEPWDLLKQMEGIKFVSGRPQVQDTPIPIPRLEFKYPSVHQQQL
jgi:hypothetical protein